MSEPFPCGLIDLAGHPAVRICKIGNSGAVFLGHPVYSLSVVLFSIILFTGLGSFVSERAAPTSRLGFGLWAGLTGLYAVALPSVLGIVLPSFETSGTLLRACVAVGLIAPAGFLMGFGFPTGMRLVSAKDDRPTPWFWGINGAAGVLASALAVALSITYGIDLTLRAGAVCYLLLIPVAAYLITARGAATAPTRTAAAQASAQSR